MMIDNQSATSNTTSTLCFTCGRSCNCPTDTVTAYDINDVYNTFPVINTPAFDFNFVLPVEPPWCMFKKFWTAWCGKYAQDIIEHIVKDVHVFMYRVRGFSLVRKVYTRRLRGRGLRTYKNIRTAYV